MAPTSNFSTLIVTTLQNQSEKIFDNVSTNNTLLRHLKKAGNIKVVSGGRSFNHPLLYAQNSSFQARASLDPIDLPVTDPLTCSNWGVKVVDGSIVLPMLDVAMNAGNKEQLLDYTNAKKMEAEISMAEVLGDQIFGTSPGSNDMDSIPMIISFDGTADTDSIGGFTASANTWWANYTTATTVGSWNSLSAGIGIGLTALDKAVNGSTFGTQGPTLIITTSTIYTLYQCGLSNNARYTSMDSGDAAFKELMYANIPFAFDSNCPSNYIYGVDTNNIRLQVLAQGNMKMTSFQQARNQLVESALYYIFCNLTCGSRRTNFVFTVTG